ncbi:MAG: carboxymuconolactone decarboxylase family protein [Solirubrobacterales bacterium]
MTTPRIPFDQLPDGLREQLRPRVERLGYLGEFFQVAAHQPDALTHFAAFTESLKEALPDRLVEAVALTVASRTGNDYERVQHERLALALGVDRDEVSALVSGELDGLDAATRAAAELAGEVCAARGGSCAAGYERLERRVGPEVAVGCLMLAGRYLAHATMANTWGLEPPVESPLDDGAVNV